MMIKSELKALIREVAEKVGIDGDLLIALCTVESSLEPFSVRFEPVYRWTLEPRAWASQIEKRVPGYSAATEEALQKFSYGLGQIMGAVMREYGFVGLLQTCMTNPKIPLEYSARHLKKFLQKYDGDEASAVAAYNAGSVRFTPAKNFVNQVYVDKVMAELRKIRRIIQ